MSTSKPNPASDFESLAKQYWSAWSELARTPTGGSESLPGWKEGLAWWSQIAGQGAGGDANAAIERMNAQAGQWFGSMQQLAANFAGKEANPAQIVKQWSESLAGAGGNPVADMFKRMSGADAHGLDAWFAQVAPMLVGWKGEAKSLLGLPTFGLGREQQERTQHLMQAQLDYQERSEAYNGQLASAGKLAFERFEKKLEERSEPGRQIESARALFDVWIDAAEEAWAEVASGAEYRGVYGQFVNAQMRLRAAVQTEIEQSANLLGLPTRSELNASHRKVAALERELRALRQQVEARVSPVVRSPQAAATGTHSTRADAPAATPATRAKRASPAKRARPGSTSRAVVAPRKIVLPQVTAPHAALRATPAAKSAAVKKSPPDRKSGKSGKSGKRR
jgi:class III poly(R)-hydroxyalkanoic acid synthase PhaE subunit